MKIISRSKISLQASCDLLTP